MKVGYYLKHDKAKDHVAAIIERVKMLTDKPEWKQPWIALLTEDSPYNAITGNPLTRGNALALNCERLLGGYEENLWLTANGARHCTGVDKPFTMDTFRQKHVTLLKPVFKKVKDEVTGEEREKFANWYAYDVWNIADVDAEGAVVDRDKFGTLPEEEADLEEVKPDARADALVDKAKPHCCKVIHLKKNSPPCYMPMLDIIEMNAKVQYHDTERYYSTLFHEMVHATGHSSRLNRLDMGGDWQERRHSYSYEELVAEMGAAFLTAQCRLKSVELDLDTIAYLKGWLDRLTDEPMWLNKAFGDAERAVKYLTEGVN